MKAFAFFFCKIILNVIICMFTRKLEGSNPPAEIIFTSRTDQVADHPLQWILNARSCLRLAAPRHKIGKARIRFWLLPRRRRSQNGRGRLCTVNKRFPRIFCSESGNCCNAFWLPPTFHCQIFLFALLPGLSSQIQSDSLELGTKSCHLDPIKIVSCSMSSLMITINPLPLDLVLVLLLLLLVALLVLDLVIFFFLHRFLPQQVCLPLLVCFV